MTPTLIRLSLSILALAASGTVAQQSGQNGADIAAEDELAACSSQSNTSTRPVGVST